MKEAAGQGIGSHWNVLRRRGQGRALLDGCRRSIKQVHQKRIRRVSVRKDSIDTFQPEQIKRTECYFERGRIHIPLVGGLLKVLKRVINDCKINCNVNTILEQIICT